MKRIFFIFVVVAVVFSLAACSEEAVLDQAKVYEIKSDIKAIEVRISAADFVIKQGNAFSVESNLKYLTVSEKNGILTILEEIKVGVSYTNPALTLYVPEGIVFENVNITTGAGKVTTDTLSAKSLKLQLGAGDVRIDSLYVTSNADIDGGTGKVTITEGAINDLDLTMGVGELNLTAAILGDSDLILGVGKSNLTLIGSKEDYSIDIEKGIGSIKVDGVDVSEFDSEGNGPNNIEIEGGVGAINLNFREGMIK